MLIEITKNNQYVGQILVRNNKIQARGSIPIIYQLLSDMKQTGPQTNLQLIENLPKLLHDNSSEFTAKVLDKSKPVASRRVSVKPNAQTVNSPEDKVQDIYLSPHRHW